MKRIFDAYSPRIITPLGVKKFLEDEGVFGAKDLDWWDETPLSGALKVQAVPAQHFSGRGMFDRDATLWCGYVLHRAEGSVYFAGDTGYNTFTFKEIGERCGPFKAALIPIGAYKPKWFMSVIHCSPEEAVQIHREVKAETSIASHFGTFPLADDGRLDPINDLKTSLEVHALKDEEFIVLNEGEGKDF
jgi:L-ascorbate metabolism protein UlaG (beta-lactamase superfamily)